MHLKPPGTPSLRRPQPYHLDTGHGAPQNIRWTFIQPYDRHVRVGAFSPTLCSCGRVSGHTHQKALKSLIKGTGDEGSLQQGTDQLGTRCGRWAMMPTRQGRVEFRQKTRKGQTPTTTGMRRVDMERPTLLTRQCDPQLHQGIHLFYRADFTDTCQSAEHAPLEHLRCTEH